MLGALRNFGSVGVCQDSVVSAAGGLGSPTAQTSPALGLSPKECVDILYLRLL